MTQSQIMSILITIVCAALFLVIHFWEKTAKKETKSQKLKSNSAKAPLLHQEFKLKYSMFSDDMDEAKSVAIVEFYNTKYAAIDFDWELKQKLLKKSRLDFKLSDDKFTDSPEWLELAKERYDKIQNIYQDISSLISEGFHDHLYVKNSGEDTIEEFQKFLEDTFRNAEVSTYNS